MPKKILFSWNFKLQEFLIHKRLFPFMLLPFFIFSTVTVSYTAHAEETMPSEGEIILRTLLQKGIITQAEYDEVMEEIGGTKNLEKRVEAVEKKTSDLAETAEEQELWREHIDKHITHAEGPVLTDGLSIAGGITVVGQGTSGNDDNVPPGEDGIDGNISADLEISAKMGEHGEAFLALEAGEGEGLEGDEIDSFWGVNADAGAGSTVDLTEAWYEHMFSGGMITFTIGKLDLTNYFDINEVANDETTQFLSGGFVNSIAVEFPDNNAGVRLTASPHELLDISLGAQSGDSDWEDIAEKPFLIAGADIKPKFGELQGNYRVYVWTNRTDHTELKDPTNDDEHGWGYGISLDQQVMDYLTLFARAGYQDKELFEIDMAWSGGLSLSGGLWGRDDDALGIAYGQAILSDDHEDVLKAGGTNPEDEGHFEAYYSIAVNEHVAITPDIQVVTNALGDGDHEMVIVGGVRGQFTF